ncbi:hypothetical protein HK405_010345 [Cladochytrium tenue]|nr:hypothetical protein HK405_010345 [Cladochytrium tenue]
MDFIEKTVAELSEADLGDSFLELRQTIALVKSDKYEDYLDGVVRGKKYSRVRPMTLVAILEKLRQHEPLFGAKSGPVAAANRNVNALLPQLKKLLK